MTVRIRSPSSTRGSAQIIFEKLLFTVETLANDLPTIEWTVSVPYIVPDLPGTTATGICRRRLVRLREIEKAIVEGRRKIQVGDRSVEVCLIDYCLILSLFASDDRWLPWCLISF